MAQKTQTKRVSVDVERCLSCKACEMACAMAHAGFDDVVEALLSGERMVPRVKVVAAKGRGLPVQCQHCEEPACAAACPTDAIHVDEQTGMAHARPDLCIGCKACVKACPYGAPVYDSQSETVLLCDLCEDIIEDGEQPRCVTSCPTGARRVIEVEDAGEEEGLEAYEEQMRQRARETAVSVRAETYRVDPELCICCGRCASECPVDCISGRKGKAPAKATAEDEEQGKVGEPFAIDQEVCIACGTCYEVCPVDAVQKD